MCRNRRKDKNLELSDKCARQATRPIKRLITSIGLAWIVLDRMDLGQPWTMDEKENGNKSLSLPFFYAVSCEDMRETNQIHVYSTFPSRFQRNACIFHIRYPDSREMWRSRLYIYAHMHSMFRRCHFINKWEYDITKTLNNITKKECGPSRHWKT